MNDQEYLVHFGILGQKHGVRNGPPYPLHKDQLSPAERAKDKGDIIREGDVKTAYYRRNEFTDQELKQVVERYNQNTKLKDIVEPKKETVDKVKQITEKMDKAGNAANAAHKVMSGGIDVYNDLAKIMSAFGFEMKTIKGKDGDNKKKGN